MIKLYLLMFAFPLFFTSCITTYVVSGVATNDSYSSLEKEANVKVVLFEDKKIPMEEIGVVQVVLTSQTNDDLSKVVNAAKKKARKMGGNIIVLKSDQLTAARGSGTIIMEDKEGNTVQEVMNYNPKYIFVVGRLEQ